MSKNNLLSEKKIPVLPKRLSLFQKISLLYSGKKANASLVGSLCTAIFILATVFLIVGEANIFDHFFKEVKLVQTVGTVTNCYCDDPKGNNNCKRHNISLSYFDANNKLIEAACYSYDKDAATKYMVGKTYDVEYLTGYFATVHLVGTNTQWAEKNQDVFGTLATAIIFIWVCLFFVFGVIFKENRNLLTVFTQWKVTIAEPKNKELFKADIDSQKVSMVRQFFTFWDEKDTEYTVSMEYKGFGNEIVVDEAWELIVYNPNQPTAFFLWDDELAFPKINPQGEFVFNKMWHIWFLFSICLFFTLFAALAFTSPFWSIS